MPTDEIKSELIQLITELFKEKGYDVDIIEYVDLIDDLGMDSITFITLIVEVEAVFGITIPDDMLLMDNFKNVHDTVQIVANQLKKE